jgi:hypothetical protein
MAAARVTRGARPACRNEVRRTDAHAVWGLSLSLYLRAVRDFYGEGSDGWAAGSSASENTPFVGWGAGRCDACLLQDP